MLFKDIANTLKTLAEVLLVVFIILSLVACIAILVYNSELFLVAVIMLIGGIVSALVGSSCLYGFGELIDKATEIADNTRPAGLAKKASNNKSQELYTSSTTTPNTKTSSSDIKKDTCDNCGKETSRITRYVINDDNGTHYRKLCVECQSKGKISDSYWICSHCGQSNPQNAAGCENCCLLK